MMTPARLAEFRADLINGLADQCDTCNMLVPYETFPATHADVFGIPCHGNKAPEPYIRNGGIQVRYQGTVYSPLEILSLVERGGALMPDDRTATLSERPRRDDWDEPSVRQAG